MLVKNVSVIDLALIELLGGKTEAPKDVLDKLRSRGLVATTGGRPALTAKGRRRAVALKPMEHDLRLLSGAAAGGRAPLHTDAAPGLRVGGGLVRIRG